MRRLLTRAFVLVALMAAAGVPLAAYLKIGITTSTGRTLNLEWKTFPIRYFVTNRGVAGVSATDFQGAIERAFATWHAVPNTRTSSTFVGFTNSEPDTGDGVTVLGYENRPDMDRTLAATNFMIDTTTGEIVESDIFFNSAFAWSTAAAGQDGRFDVESIALHEIGHLFGLSHSALGETELRNGGRRVLGAGSVMFPIAFSAGDISDRVLRADDIAGISDIYGTSAFDRATGSISGRVTKNGQGVYGAHVVAFSPASGKLIGAFSLTADGSFVVAGLDPGPQVLRVEPLDDADLDSFFDDSADVDVDFTVTFSDRLVVVPRGGGVRNVVIKVSPK